MTDATLASAVLLRVAEFLRELPAADVTALAEGRARLAVVPAGPGDSGPAIAATRAPSVRRAAAPATDLDRARAALAGMSSRHDGTAYLSSWPATGLRALAGQLGVRGVSGLRKADLIDRIVDGTIGFRLNSSAIRQL